MGNTVGKRGLEQEREKGGLQGATADGNCVSVLAFSARLPGVIWILI